MRGYHSTSNGISCIEMAHSSHWWHILWLYQSSPLRIGVIVGTAKSTVLCERRGGGFTRDWGPRYIGCIVRRIKDPSSLPYQPPSPGCICPFRGRADLFNPLLRREIVPLPRNTADMPPLDMLLFGASLSVYLTRCTIYSHKTAHLGK